MSVCLSQKYEAYGAGVLMYFGDNCAELRSFRRGCMAMRSRKGGGILHGFAIFKIMPGSHSVKFSFLETLCDASYDFSNV